jgi:glucosamine--fructose-6-phosphate aminotransferase (isomerizing)
MTMMEKEIRETPAVLAAALPRYAEKLAPAVRAMADRRIRFAIFAGRGSSDNSGIYFKYLLETAAGIPTAFAAPSVITLYGAEPDMKETLVIGASQSGQAADVAAVLLAARRQGAVTVAVTNDPDSPVARAAAHSVDLATGPEQSVAATKTFTSELAALGLFAAMIAGDKTLETAIMDVPRLLGGVLAIAAPIGVEAARMRATTSCFILGRGHQLAIAHEFALKLQETCYVRAYSHSFPDFQHGPFALAEKDASFLLLAPSGKTMPDALAMVERLSGVGADILAFTDDVALPVARKIILPPARETVQPLAFAVAAQLFACRLAAEKGQDPDAPRGLRKVTVTL